VLAQQFPSSGVSPGSTIPAVRKLPQNCIHPATLFKYMHKQIEFIG
jgi:hypothetical protein